MERQTLLDITNAAPIWIWKTDEYGYFIFMNPAMRDVLQVENVAYSKLCDVLQLDSAEDQFAMLIDKDSDALRKVMIGDKAHDMRIIIKTHQGRGARGNTGLALDMTEHLRLQALTYQQQKLESLGTLVGGVAHNFNNMLAGMKGYAFLAKNKISGQADDVQQLDKLDTVLNDAAEMVKQLLAFVHKGMDSKQHVELNEIIQNTYAITQLSMPANIRFDAQISNEKMTVYGNASALQQVFVNLVVNARDAVESADSKKVITTRLERMIVDTDMQQTHPDLQVSFVACLSVEDNGCGIKPEHLKYIFEPFFTNKEVGQGTGLGLSMSIGTVESYGGWIDIDSTLGKGSVFRIFLPLTEKTRHKQ